MFDEANRLAPEGVIVRAGVPGDLPYVYDTWLRDARDADPGPLPNDLWFPAHRAMLDRVLSDPAVTVAVAAAADDPREILGYVVAEPNEVLWWINVRKGPVRGRGLAKLLLTAAGCPPEVPSAWATRDSRRCLKNRPAGRRLRGRAARPRTSGASA